MKSSIPQTLLLICHPQTNSRLVHGIASRALRPQLDTLHLTYTLTGEIGRLRLPPPRPTRRADRLWQHTCFEAFVSLQGDSAYHEFNFAPSGEWAAYAFCHYRERAPLATEAVAPAITVGRAADSFEIRAVVRLDLLLRIQTPARLRLGLSAVIEEEDGTLSYWALRHPPGKPDFHHPDGFVLVIDPPDLEVASESFMNKR